MAVAEARAAWQRTANRCFVQEDAKRAPKLACCPSSSSSSSSVDPASSSSSSKQVDVPDHPTTGFMPLNKVPLNSNLTPDTKWWLQLQPNYGYQKGFPHEQINPLEKEMLETTLKDGTTETTVKPSEVSSWSGQDSTNTNDTLCCKNLDEFLLPGDMKKSCESKQSSELSFDSEFSWIRVEKTEPWWRTADRYELASLVAQKSLEHIENCDLPRPQKTQVTTEPFACIGSVDHNGSFRSSLDLKAQNCSYSDTTVNAWGGSTFGSAKRTSVEEGFSIFDKRLSYNTARKDMRETRTEVDSSKAQLLEALRHSQTRAREAENAAKQAYAEKEHIIQLFFRQASQLFAYKQWFQLQQIETLYLQIKNKKEQPISTLVPAVIPWMPYKARKMRKGWSKSGKVRKSKRISPRYNISRYAVVFALGLSLVGAGLLLGWTVGWMLPTF